MKQETYNSSTLGPIPLSFTGRHLLQTLRECEDAAIEAGNRATNENALATARGRLAQYISKLEQRQDPTKPPYSAPEEIIKVRRTLEYMGTRTWIKTTMANNSVRPEGCLISCTPGCSIYEVEVREIPVK